MASTATEMSGATSPETMKARMHDYFCRAYELGDESVLEEMIAEDCHTHGLSLEPVRGRAFFKEWYTGFRSSFSEIKCPVTHAWVEGDWVIVRVHFQGKHTGDGLGMPATGKRISLPALVAARFENGRVVESFNEFNRLAMLQQLGVG